MVLSLRYAVIALAAFSSASLVGCSQPTPADTASATAAGTSAAGPRQAFPFGSKIDSLNGIMGHPFGQPLTDFPKLRALPADPGQLLRGYDLPEGQHNPGWFGKHEAQVPIQLYSFLDGKFAHFRAVGDAATLRAEALYLLGPGLAQGSHQFFWEGSRARAVYTEEARGLGWEGTLDVLSKPLEAAQTAQAQAQLKADNTQ